jgi:hypothetical protein
MASGKRRWEATVAEREDIRGSAQSGYDGGGGGNIDIGIIYLPESRVDAVGEALPGKRELGVDTGLVAARVFSVPFAVDENGDKTVQAVLRARAIGGETLVAEAGGDTFGSEERGEQVGFCVAEADAHAQDLAGGQGDARVLDVY